MNILSNSSLATPFSSTYNASKAILAGEITKRRIEISLLVDRQANIVVSSTSDSSPGLNFNPSGIVSDILSNPRPVMITVIMNSSFFLSLNPPTWTDSYANPSLVLNSSLNPSNGYSGLVVVRLSAIPAYQTGNTNTASPDGVIIMGDMINGKEGLNEIVVTAYQSGYAGTYYQDPASGSLTFLSGVYLSALGAAYEYDVDLTSVIQDYASQMSTLEIGDAILFSSKLLYCDLKCLTFFLLSIFQESEL
jgi:hypothetical protein